MAENSGQPDGFDLAKQRRVTMMPIAILILLYVSARFAFEIAGWAGAARTVILFGLMEAIII